MGIKLVGVTLVGITLVGITLVGIMLVEITLVGITLVGDPMEFYPHEHKPRMVAHQFLADQLTRLFIQSHCFCIPSKFFIQFDAPVMKMTFKMVSLIGKNQFRKSFTLM